MKLPETNLDLCKRMGDDEGFNRRAIGLPSHRPNSGHSLLPQPSHTKGNGLWTQNRELLENRKNIIGMCFLDLLGSAVESLDLKCVPT